MVGTPLLRYADALLEAGRESDAREWFARAAIADEEGLTDAGERVDELDGVAVVEESDADDLSDDDVQG